MLYYKMNKIALFFNYPRNEYFGGIANIISNYTINSDLFNKNDFKIVNLNPELKFSKNKLASKIQKIYFLKKEKKCVKQFFKLNGDTNVFHIHSSRGWILYNDLKLACYVKSRFNVTVVLSIHFADIDYILSSNHFIRNKEVFVLTNFIDHIIVLSKQMKHELTFLGVDSNKISVLYTFHSFLQNMKGNYNISQPIPHLLFIGSLDERKGILDLLSALELVDDYVVLNVCGGFADKKTREKFEQFLEKDNRIIFNGYVNGDKKEKLFRESDILVLPSYGEGMPIVIMEALYYGCAIISTCVGAIPEIIHKENGILINPGDIQKLSGAIHTLVSNKNIINNMKKKNILIGEKYSLKENIKSLCQIYWRLLNDKQCN